MWSYHFLTDRTEDGRQLRILVVIDEFTRECLAIEAARSFTARNVIMNLQYLFAVRVAPEHLRRENGPGFVAKEIQAWLVRACVCTLYIQKASPWENGYVESFNCRLRDELLDWELFLSLPRGERDLLFREVLLPHPSNAPFLVMTRSKNLTPRMDQETGRTSVDWAGSTIIANANQN